MKEGVLIIRDNVVSVSIVSLRFSMLVLLFSCKFITEKHLKFNVRKIY